jgi:hypothetical protein
MAENQTISNKLVEQNKAERRDRVVNTPTSHSGSPGLKSQPVDRLSWLEIFVVFLSPPGNGWDSTLKLRHDRFLPHPLQFIIHHHPLIPRYIVWVTEKRSLNKLQTNCT